MIKVKLKQYMKNKILIPLIIITGLLFNACNNNNADNSQTEISEEHKLDSEETITNENENTELVNFSEETVDDTLADKIKTYINTDFLTEGDLRAISEEQKKFQLYKVDLNNDGDEEIFVNFITSYFCGTGGCTLLLLDSNLELITKFSPTQTLYVENALTNDWSVLLTKSEGKWRELIYEFGTYASNPTMVDAVNKTPSEHAKILFDQNGSKTKTYRF